ncbi:sensor histidine kinase, partial [Bacillus mycoides]|nr:sensor histidine kinase [Bacillus mycoides]
MGLYLVYEITKQLGHNVEIHSEVGKGTVVRIKFCNV